MRFLDGPMEGKTFSVTRCPTYLRAVIDADGTYDVLNLLTDVPKPSEQIHVYRVVPGTWTFAFIDFRGKDKGRSGRYEMADYVHVPDVDGESVRETAAWQAWATARGPVGRRDALMEDEGG
jgi:hypothetical protein